MSSLFQTNQIMKKAFHRRHRLPSTNPNPSILLNPLPEVADSKIKIYFSKKQKVSSSFTHGASSRMVISELNSNRSNNEGIVNLTKKSTCANGRACPATVTMLVDGGHLTLAKATLGDQ
ncbi:hypothetical protein TNCV_502651 [Trichonephila clavipes]|nr:hypothetical protein TNCV_502651 [Trichonephila clavipes]